MSRTTTDRRSTSDVCCDVVAAATAGDQDAARDLLLELQPRIIQYCRARIGYSQSSYSSADDVAQEILLNVLTSLQRYRGEIGEFYGFVFGIARHKIADFHRARARDASVPVDVLPEVADLWSGPDELAMRSELGRQLASLLNRLTAKQRDVLALRLVVGLSTDETACALSTSVGAVRILQHRALASLRRHCDITDGALSITKPHKRKGPRS